MGITTILVLLHYFTLNIIYDFSSYFVLGVNCA